jgi:hypothetical protein
MGLSGYLGKCDGLLTESGIPVRYTMHHLSGTVFSAPDENQYV